jgi:POT family proton-dependent oligopeptide transporter
LLALDPGHSESDRPNLELLNHEVSPTSMNGHQIHPESRTLFGHPTGLFTLFFAEMWERFSYYGMRALLILYIAKAFLNREFNYGDAEAYTIYGAYTSLVYMTPFFGGLLADRLLGCRRAVVLGGLLMAAGHLMMTVENVWTFFAALALLICGNGFFKPNISTIVGSLYPQGSPKRDSGFTVFYMGINLGAAMSPLLCGYIGETYGWHYGFGLATIGMLAGIAVFVAPTLVTQLLVMSGALAAAVGMFLFHGSDAYSTATNVVVGVALLAAAVISLVALGRGGLPAEAGAPPDANRLRRLVGGLIPAEWVVYLGTLLAVPVFVLLVSGFAPLRQDKRSVRLVPASVVNSLQATKVLHGHLKGLRRYVEAQSSTGVAAVAEESQKSHEKQELTDEQYLALQEGIQLAQAGQWGDAATAAERAGQAHPRQRGKIVLATVLSEVSRPFGLVLFLSALIALGYVGVEMLVLDKIARQRLLVVLVLTFFSMLFWAFYEQAGSSVNNFTDRNVDRVLEARTIAESDVGTPLRLRVLPTKSVDAEINERPPLTQEQLGYEYQGKPLTMSDLIRMQDQAKKEEQKDREARAAAETRTGQARESEAAETKVPVVARVILWPVTGAHVGMGVGGSEIPASVFQSVNPLLILIFGLIFTALWVVLAKWNLEPSTPLKFALGLAQLGLGFGAFWYGAQTADGRGMVLMGWLLLGYLLHTTGELCLSPVGLSMVTKLSPAKLVSTMMGVWFLATAFSQALAGIIAQFTGVTEQGGGKTLIPVPKETVNVYGDVFGTIAISALVSAVICLFLAPLLSRWMHPEVELGGKAEPSGEA